MSLEKDPPKPEKSERLFVAGFYLNRSGHEYNELLGYRRGAAELGLDCEIIVPVSADAGLAEKLQAQRLLPAGLPSLPNVKTVSVREVAAYGDTNIPLSEFWKWLSDHHLSRSDKVYFVQANLFLVKAVVRWLSGLKAEQRPAVFFRFIGDEMLDHATGEYAVAAAFFGVVCDELRSCDGHERVYFLASSRKAAIAIRLACRRRVFLMPMPKLLNRDAAQDRDKPKQSTTKVISAAEAKPLKKGVAQKLSSMLRHLERRSVGEPVRVYLHFNPRSGALIKSASGMIRTMSRRYPSAHFIIKTGGADIPGLGKLGQGTKVTVLPKDQNAADYLGDLAAADIVVLAYENAIHYKFATSGVFTEAVAFGKPVVVPDDTWMSEQLVEGHGAGSVYRGSRAAHVVEGLVEVVENLPAYVQRAAGVAHRESGNNSSRSYLERMLDLAAAPQDMTPDFTVGEEVSFNDPIESRPFMRQGWGDTEDWGVWTVAADAELALLIEGDPGPLYFNFLVAPFIRKNHPEATVVVSTGDDQEVASWSYSLSRQGRTPRWRSIRLHPMPVAKVISVRFRIVDPRSPNSLGLSQDMRMLGLGFRKMSLTRTPLEVDA